MQDPIPTTHIAQLEASIASLQGHRAVLGDAAVDAAVAALRDKIAALQQAGQEQQLRLVSVLFADVVGSTVLSRHLDPEDVSAVVDGALLRYTAIVQAHGGQVMQYAGDNVLAVFGTPTVREDDAERAVRAGLAIAALGPALGAEVQARHGQAGFNVRVGIHSGDVLMGGGVEGANSVRGLTPNIAARMEQTAPPGGLRISQDTYRLVRGRFELRAQPPLLVKGCDEPMVTYLVLGELGSVERAATRGVEGIATRMVGRSAQLARLQQAYLALAGAAADDDDGPATLQLLCVVGDAGLGKSRLLGEFRLWADMQIASWLDTRMDGLGGGLLDGLGDGPDGGPAAAPARGAGPALASGRAPAWLLASATEQRMNQPYAALRSLLTGVTGLLDSDTAAEARRKWLQATAPDLGEAAAAVLGHLLGLDFSAHEELRGLLGEPRQLRDRAFFHASQLLRAWAGRGRPLVAVLDDLHWADDGTLDFIDHLGSAHADLPLLLLTLSRPTLAERRPAWLAGLTVAQRIELGPLARASAAELAGELLANLGSAARELEALLLDHAEGNPFHLEELVNLLIDQGVITTGDADALIGDDGIHSAWQLHAERLHALKVPPTLAGVLRARLDALPQDERRMAQLASVVGYRFWDASLAALDAPALDHLDGLLSRELATEQQPASLAGLREYTFKHQSLHEVAYDSVLRRTRRHLHARVADWLLSLPGTPPLELVAQHYERGGQPALALDYWHRAAEAAASSYANAQALKHVERALALAPEDDLERRISLCVLRCRVLERLADRVQRERALDELRQLANTNGDARRSTEFFILQSRFHSDGGDELAALENSKLAVRCLPNQISALTAEAHARQAQCLSRLGHRNAAQIAARDALEVARAANAKRIEGIVLNDIGIQADEDGDSGIAIEFYLQALSIHRQIGDRTNEGGTLNNIGYAAMILGEYKPACERFIEANTIFENIGHKLNEGITLINLGIAQLNLGKFEVARGTGQRALTILRSIKGRASEAAALRLIGQAEIELAKQDQALRHLIESRKLFNDLGMRHLAIESVAAIAQLHMTLGERQQALDLVRGILAQLDEGVSLEGTEEPLRILLVCFQVLETHNEPRAREVLKTAYQTLDARAKRISGKEKQKSYMTGVPFHAAIVTAWNATQP
ncbi:MAG: hypothetical protein RLY71_4132 [Pseudomonadota bacterium]